MSPNAAKRERILQVANRECSQGGSPLLAKTAMLALTAFDRSGAGREGVRCVPACGGRRRRLHDASCAAGKRLVVVPLSSRCRRKWKGTRRNPLSSDAGGRPTVSNLDLFTGSSGCNFTFVDAASRHVRCRLLQEASSAAIDVAAP